MSGADPEVLEDQIGAGELESGTVVIRIGDMEFGLPVAKVREVLHVPPITRLPFAPSYLPGVVSVRGAVVPVVDLGDRLFGKPCSRAGRLVVVDEPSAGSTVALLVDGVADLVSAQTLLDEPPEIGASLPSGWIEGVVSPAADRLVTLLDLEKVLDRNEEPDEESR